ncbi:MAG: EI24 domain-containing protein [Pseudomonadota bacterium]|uniref:EI24 domain-containing protein n=1 Tax=Caldimonas aquatica TaxID=376175 RepID=A0ABY6MVQ8_9BURK|nr:EI24 domain-containing protein [Schlegelella aquatica]UZD56087.1 EI24 domain-containing protein [Schlegelella aquatica]
MSLLLDAFWRAVAYCLHPRVMILSLLPLVGIAALTFVLGWFFWEPAVDAVRLQLEQWALVEAALGWLESIGAHGLRGVLAPLIVVVLAVPLIVIASLLAVGLFMTPWLVRLVAARRFPALERRQGESWWRSVAWALASTVVALLALVVSVPLWLIPPLVFVLPPLIWGWLTYRVMSFDALAEHATREERLRLTHEHRWQLWAMGVLSGYAGAAPSLVWAFGAVSFIFAPLLIVASVWIYTVVFAFSSLWFVHYCLAALQLQRAREAVPVAQGPDDDAGGGASGTAVGGIEHRGAAPALPPSASNP